MGPQRILDTALNLENSRSLSPPENCTVYMIEMGKYLLFCMAVTSSSNVIIHQKCSRPPPERISHPVDNDVKL